MSYRTHPLFRLNKLIDAGEVKRLHTVPTLRTQTVGQHVYGSQVIAVELMNRAMVEDHEVSAASVLLSLLMHDAPEVDTGDVPAPTKRKSLEVAKALDEMEAEFYDRMRVELPSLNELENDIVKASDVLDLMMTCVRERQMGNRHPRLEQVMTNASMYLDAQASVPGVAALRDHFWELWHNSREEQ